MPAPRQMSRSDYETLSAALAESVDDVDLGARRHVAFDVADALTGTSDRFDPVLWLRQCEVGPVSAKDVAEWTKRLDLRVKSIGAKRLNSKNLGYDIEQYIDESGSPIPLDKS